MATLPYEGPDASALQQLKYLAYELLLRNPWALLKASVVGATWQAATFMAVAVPLAFMSPLLVVYGAVFLALALGRGVRVVAGWPFAPRAADEISDPPPGASGRTWIVRPRATSHSKSKPANRFHPQA